MMDAQQFAYWLQGFSELNEQPPTAEQWKAIREHLALVFKKVTPQLGAVPVVPDLKDSPIIKEMIERARREYRPSPVLPIYPPSGPYWLERPSTGLPPGTIIC